MCSAFVFYMFDIFYSSRQKDLNSVCLILDSLVIPLVFVSRLNFCVSVNFNFFFPAVWTVKGFSIPRPSNDPPDVENCCVQLKKRL